MPHPNILRASQDLSDGGKVDVMLSWSKESARNLNHARIGTGRGFDADQALSQISKMVVSELISTAVEPDQSKLVLSPRLTSFVIEQLDLTVNGLEVWVTIIGAIGTNRTSTEIAGLVRQMLRMSFPSDSNGLNFKRKQIDPDLALVNTRFLGDKKSFEDYVSPIHIHTDIRSHFTDLEYPVGQQTFGDPLGTTNKPPDEQEPPEAGTT